MTRVLQYSDLHVTTDFLLDVKDMHRKISAVEAEAKKVLESL